MTSNLIEGKKVIIIDDHKLFTNGLCTILESIGLRVMATFSNGKDALTYIKNQELDLILSDINMPEMDGLQLIKRIVAEKINVKIIMLSMYEDPSIIKASFACGASAYLSKNSDKKEIIKAITQSLEGNTYVKKSLLKVKETKQLMDDKFSYKYKLTIREREILKCLLQEKTNKEIGQELNISRRTVETHRKNILLKFGCKNNIGLAKIAVSYKLFD
jgi:DNA-binding NarL/FixJ family response regulator